MCVKTLKKAGRANRSLGVGWWAHRDLNPGPFGYEPTALTAELWARHVNSKGNLYSCPVIKHSFFRYFYPPTISLSSTAKP
jgi:hypothetical protein